MARRYMKFMDSSDLGLKGSGPGKGSRERSRKWREFWHPGWRGPGQGFEEVRPGVFVKKYKESDHEERQ